MNKKISILVDNDSWVLPYAKELMDQLRSKNYDVQILKEHHLVKKGWINFMLGCVKIASPETLSMNRYNLVVHESNLPHGKGFAPMTWQIIDGKLRIPICLIEASDKLDSGDIWLKDIIELDGTELNQKWRQKQGQKTIDLCINFVENFNNLKPVPQDQVNSPISYKRRTVEDSELDINKSIKEQFNLLRVVDNQKYPAFFIYQDVKYSLKIESV